MTGCLRYGVSAWLTLEAVVYEITGTKAVRKKDKVTGFTLLDTP
jgi:predicted DNA-binding protein with PD1-like motif